MTFLACMGDATNPDSWSSTPFHLLDAALPAGLINEGLALHPETPKFQRLRIGWNLWSLLTGKGRGGFQYAPVFLEKLWRPLLPKIRTAANAGPVRIINHFQLFPPSLQGDDSIEKWFYLDATLSLLASDYTLPLPLTRLRDVIRRERAGYHAARGIITMARHAADSVINDYGVPPEKVHVAVPGANFSAAQYAAIEPLLEQRQHAQPSTSTPQPGSESQKPPLRLLVIGKDWYRKGVDILLDAIIAARPRGLNATLRIVGLRREELPEKYRQVPGVEFLGYVSRKSDPAKFVQLVLDNDLGCLLSRAEAAGIAVREYLALGMPVLASTAGGLADMCDPDCCLMVPPSETPEAIARHLLDLQAHPDKLARLRQIAFQRRRTRLWDSTVASILKFWPQE
jgi:glycosyltransferase involved in cell wall biosynthesis